MRDRWHMRSYVHSGSIYYPEAWFYDYSVNFHPIHHPTSMSGSRMNVHVLDVSRHTPKEIS